MGNRRFRAPLALNTARVAWETKGRVVDATAYPDFCIQGTTGSTSYTIIGICGIGADAGRVQREELEELPGAKTV